MLGVMTEKKQRRLPPLYPDPLKEDPEDTTESPRRPRNKKKPAEGEKTPRERKARSLSRRREGSDAGEEARSAPHSPETPQPATVRKKKKNIGSSRETLVAGNESPNQTQNVPRKKKKKKVKVKPNIAEEDYGLGADLTGIRDDIVDSPDGEASTHIGVPAMRSEPTNRIFIEQKGGFKTKDKAKLAKMMVEQQLRAMEIPEEATSQTTIQFALATHKVFRTATIFCQGILAGFALWHIITVWVMTSYSGSQAFLQVYHRLALPVQSLYYILFALSTVAVFDRYDLACPNKRFVKRAFTLQNGAVSTLLYFLAMVFSVAIAATDDRIGLYTSQPSLWTDPLKTKKELERWRILSIVRGVLAILGWLVVAIKPTTDRLTKNLEKAEDNIYDDQQHTPADVVRNTGV